MYLQNKKSKKAFDLPFSWIFAIIAGSVIIIISIYATVKFVGVGKTYDYSMSAQTIANILDEAVSGLASTSIISPIQFRKETRIYLDCEVYFPTSPVFGRQTIAFSEESGFIQKWASPGMNISRYNKYIFGEKLMQSKKYLIFSKPFYSGFKVDDLVYIIPTTKDYCFIGAPEEIQKNILSFNFENLNNSESITKCKENSLKVCFDFNSQECNIIVSYDNSDNFGSGTILKDNQRLSYFNEGLLYAGIFSSPEIYDCNIERLGNKINVLGQVYKDKIELLSGKECGSLISPSIDLIIDISKNLTSEKLGDIYQEAKTMDRLNCNSACPIYGAENCLGL
ncbi:MAG: hypothetical protein Q8L27_02305 [archaeon]|nr:hypothetical protein [archaeon]